MVLAEKGLSKKSYALLSSILEELEIIMENKCLPLFFPRIIADSGDFSAN